MTSTPVRQAIYREIEAERQRQNAKHGPPIPGQHRHGHYTWSAILSEEVGEINRALLQDDIPRLREELVQTTAVTIAGLVVIDHQPDTEEPLP